MPLKTPDGKSCGHKTLRWPTDFSPRRSLAANWDETPVHVCVQISDGAARNFNSLAAGLFSGSPQETTAQGCDPTF